jgi:hypothetical protein
MGSFIDLGQWRPTRRNREGFASVTLQQWLGIALGLLLVGFIVFAFRQGEKVKPSGRDPDAGLSDIPPSTDHHP